MNLRLLLIPCLALGVAFGAPGCGTEDDEPDPMGPGDVGKPPAEMVGTWVFGSVTVDGTPSALDVVMEWTPATVEARLHVMANSAYVFEEVDTRGGQLWFESGFIYIDGDELDVNIQLDGDGPTTETIRWGFSLIEGVFILQRVVAGKVVAYTLTQGDA